MSDPIEVVLLGQRLHLKGTGDRERTARLAKLVQTKIDEVGGMHQGAANNVRVALLAALNLADDCLRAREDDQAFRREVQSRSRILLDELEAHGIV